jgi:DNA (cytosine-5)-methyltransferase 1
MTLRVLDLFSGIGGFSLGLERSGGFKTVAFCEIEPFCQKVLRKHWPEVPIYDDVRTLSAERLAADGIGVDVICGGFPCQDISIAGKGAGLAGERSGLWREYARLIGELRPRYVLVENVAALLHRGLGDVLGDLAALGYDAEWHCIPASAVGAPHRRDRIWIVSYRDGDGEPVVPVDAGTVRTADMAYPNKPRLASEFCKRFRGVQATLGSPEGRESRGGIAAPYGRAWLVEPAVGRVANGVPARMDRLRALGNAVVPQIPEMLGRAILEAEAA